jgi:hypothetical protein
MIHGLLYFTYFTVSMLMLFGPITARATEPQATGPGTGHSHNASAPPGWVEQLKGQTIIEDAMEGRACDSPASFPSAADPSRARMLLM